MNRESSAATSSAATTRMDLLLYFHDENSLTGKN